ncbi:MAG: DUF4383 domain-containing protein [Candidatus Yanofskybacteria bacterium]|nr:DUF4383 domain-containing protein [Candidatus Yanofskybacteria bacterium]
MSPRQFLQAGGLTLILAGILGMVGVIGPTPDKSLFGDYWWFDNAENWAHLILGMLGLMAGYIFPADAQRIFVTVFGIAGIVIGLYGLFVNSNFLGASFQNPADNIFHLAIGVWAFIASRKSPVY